MGKSEIEVEVLGKMFLEAASEAIAQKSTTAPSSDPEVKVLDILEYDGRMRIVSMEQFNGPAYISVVNYFLSARDMEKHVNCCGALVVYVESSMAEKLLKALGHADANEEEEQTVLSACGQVATVFAESFANKLAGSGYQQLTLAEPKNYKNAVNDGVEYSKDQVEKAEVSFSFWKQRALVMDVVIGAIPHT